MMVRMVDTTRARAGFCRRLVSSMGALLYGILAMGCAAHSGFLVGGVQVNEPDDRYWVETLKRAGMNTVAVTYYARQGDWDSDQLWIYPDTEGLRQEIRLAKEAGLKVTLILRVSLDHGVERNRFLWHGMIMPRTDADVRVWFERYTEFLLTWARVAEEEGVDVFGIGSELNALASTTPVRALPKLEFFYLDPNLRQQYREYLLRLGEGIDPDLLRGAWGETYDSLARYVDTRTGVEWSWAERTTKNGDTTYMNARRRLLEAEWIALIGRIRDVYAGALTYAANFDQYQQVSFWRHLDFIGINAYFPLREGNEPASALYPALEESWQFILRRLADYRCRAGLTDKPVLFTELGYTFSENSTIAPWAADGFALVGDWKRARLMIFEGRPEDHDERTLAVRALRHAAARVERELSDARGDGAQARLLAGLLYWKLSTKAYHSAVEPFVLIVGPESNDPLLDELRRFAQDRAAP